MIATHCHDCQGALPVHPPGHQGAVGYALTYQSGGGQPQAICYPCADKRQIAQLKGATRFLAYVGKLAITTWTGGHLMKIVRAKSMRLTRRSWVHGSSILSIRAVDVHGQEWIGRGNVGIAIKLRRIGGAR